MKLSNRFDEADKIRVWADAPYCVLCRSNQGCSLHHIKGCKKDCYRSIYNSVMLCHDHHKEADGHNTDSEVSREYQAMLLRATAQRILEAGYDTKTKYDEEFLST